jgi:hypothetical protein
MNDDIKPDDHPDFIGGWVWTALEIRWIEERIAREREACAKVCDELDSNSYPYVVVFPNKCAEAIRARGGEA